MSIFAALLMLGIGFMINLIIGLLIYVRVQSLAECPKHEQKDLEYNDWYIIVLFWCILGIMKLWKEGINGL